jgi:hypothetical protein
MSEPPASAVWMPGLGRRERVKVVRIKGEGGRVKVEG